MTCNCEAEDAVVKLEFQISKMYILAYAKLSLYSDMSPKECKSNGLHNKVPVTNASLPGMYLHGMYYMPKMQFQSPLEILQYM